MQRKSEAPVLRNFMCDFKKINQIFETQITSHLMLIIPVLLLVL